MRDRQSTPDTKSHHSQPTKERETQRTTAQQEDLVTQQDPLTQTISRIGSPPSAKVHANLLSRATADHLARGRQLMLQMQRQYGNRYVQRVVELSRQGAGETEATPEVEATIEQARGGGRSLDTGIQRQMESAFGTNFSGVRVHTDSTADALNQSLSARAFTTGQDIFFRQGEYNPGSSSGKELLAHELTHVVQQTGTVRGKLAIGEAGDRYEQEADKVASEVLQRLDAPAAVQRQEAIEEELQAKPEITALQRQEEPDEELQAKPSISALQRQEEAKNPNQTGLPDELKAGVENLSGYSLDDVRVHYNSSKPAQLQALAYTQGTEIHVAPGQEEHLPHEAWHVVQQMQGRVKPTMQMKGVQINDDAGLEREADVMGRKVGVNLRKPATCPTIQPNKGKSIIQKIGGNIERSNPVINQGRLEATVTETASIFGGGNTYIVHTSIQKHSIGSYQLAEVTTPASPPNINQNTIWLGQQPVFTNAFAGFVDEAMYYIELNGTKPGVNWSTQNLNPNFETDGTGSSTNVHAYPLNGNPVVVLSNNEYNALKLVTRVYYGYGNINYGTISQAKRELTTYYVGQNSFVQALMALGLNRIGVDRRITQRENECRAENIYLGATFMGQ